MHSRCTHAFFDEPVGDAARSCSCKEEKDNCTWNCTCTTIRIIWNCICIIICIIICTIWNCTFIGGGDKSSGSGGDCVCSAGPGQQRSGPPGQC